MAVAGFLAAGAAGGASAAIVDNQYGTCMDEAEEKENLAAQEAAEKAAKEAGK